MSMIARACRLAPLEPLPEGLDAAFHGLQGRLRRLRNPAGPLLSRAREVLQVCDTLMELPDDELARRIVEARSWMRLDPASAKGHLVQVLATIGQVAWRELGMKPHAVQFMGALALHQGLLPEMATGEGKTLTVALAGVLAGLSGRPCHVITANDYLAGRDAHEVGRLYRACGLSIASVVAELDPLERPQRYACDVVYLTAKELLADYLRDQIGQGSVEQLVRLDFRQWLFGGEREGQRLLVRGLHTAIIDEADSILIDEAVTPLILAAPRESCGLADAVRTVSALADGMLAGTDYIPQPNGQSVTLRPVAVERLTALAPTLPELWRPAARREELLRQALLVRCFFKPGQHYLVQDGEVVLLDEFTGRMTPGRSLTAGLHQAIEACEGLAITDPNQSLTQMSFQTYFRRFRKLAGCSGTAWESAAELWRVYGLQVVRVPTHRPRLTVYRPPVVVDDAQRKWQQIAVEVLQEQRRGRPVLVGVRSVTASEALATVLRQRGCEVNVLNALAHAEEAAIVAGAGQPGVVTIATNMAGRGTDIRLGEGVVAVGGLHVIVAEANDSIRIDRQLAGRCGRQGDPGSVSTYLCLSDDLVRRMMPAVLHRVVRGLLQSFPAWAAVAARHAFRQAQKRAEAQAFQRRWSVLRSDDWMKSALPFDGRRRGEGA